MILKRLSALLLSATILMGCGSTGQSTSDSSTSSQSQSEIVTKIDKPVEITFWHAMNQHLESTLKRLTDKFMAENPNIKVTLQNQSSYPELQQKITATSASPKNLPTMTQAYTSWVYDQINDGLVLDLKPYIENEEIKFDNYEDIVEGLRKGPTIDGKIYGIPFNKSTEIMWYNKPLFEELNLQVPTTYEEFANVAKTIKEKKGIVGAGFDALNIYYTTFLKNENTDFNSNLDVTGEVSTKAVNYYLDGIKNGYFRIAGIDNFLSGPFASESVGMYIGSNAGESFVKQAVGDKFEVGAAAYPAEYSLQQGTDLFVFSNATPEQKTAAYEYLKFLTSTENQIDWAKSTGYLPIRQSAIDSDEYQNSDSLVPSVIRNGKNKLYTNPISKGSSAAINEIVTVLENILSDPNSNVDAKLKEFKNTLMGIWE